MPWLRLDDVGYDDPVVRAVGNGAYGAWVRMQQYCSAQRTDGWIDASKARELASRAELRALTDTRVTADSPVLLHLHGDECPCLEGREWPATQGGFMVHAFLDRNPSRSENDVHKAKRRELRDKELRQAVKDRDGDRCRYCGVTVKWSDRKTPLGGVLDHIDPTIAAGADNLVVACRGCNGRKKDCTPAAAGMTLLPAPDQAGQINDGSNAGSTTDLERINDRSKTGSKTVPDPDLDPDPDPVPDPDPPPHHPTAPDRATKPQENRSATQINDEINDQMTAGQGRGGDGPGTAQNTRQKTSAGDAGPTGRRPTIGPPTTPRSQLAPNPYTRSPHGQPARASPAGGDG